MKTVYRASDSIEANIVKGMLESHHIEAHVQGEHMATAYGGLVPALDVRIKVSDEDEHRAKKVIAEYQSSNPSSGHSE